MKSFSLKMMMIFSLLLLSGCWDRVEINDIALVLAAGIDLVEDEQIELSLQISIPTSMGGGQQSGGGSGTDSKGTTVEIARGRTVYDAMTKLQAKVPRRIFWGHLRTIFIGENLAKSGIKPHLDFFARHPQPRLRAYLFVTKGNPKELLIIQPKIESNSAEVAREIAAFKIGLDVTLKDLFEMLIDESGDAALPWLKAVKGATGDLGLVVDGTAIFKEDKMVGYLDESKTRGLLWLRDEIGLASVVLEPEGTEGYMSFNLLRSKTKLTPKIENGKWKMVVNIKTEDDAVENQTNLDLMDSEVIKRLEKGLEAAVVKRIQESLEYIQHEVNADVLHFSKRFHREYPKEWAKVKDEWDEKFSEIEVEINAKAYIRRPGVSGAPQGLPDKEVKRQ